MRLKIWIFLFKDTDCYDFRIPNGAESVVIENTFDQLPQQSDPDNDQLDDVDSMRYQAKSVEDIMSCSQLPASVSMAKVGMCCSAAGQCGNVILLSLCSH